MSFPPNPRRGYFSFLFTDLEVKVAKIKEIKGKKTLEFFSTIPLPKGLIIESEVKDPKALGKILLDFKKNSKIKENFVVIGLPETKATTHILVLPPLETREIDQAISYQADSFLPFPLKDVYLDWMILETTPNEIKILVSAIPKNIIDGYISSFEEAELAPLAFESTSLSLLRLLPKDKRNSCLISEINQTMTILVLDKDGSLKTSPVVLEKEQFLPTIIKILTHYFPKRTEGEPPLKLFLCGPPNPPLMKNLKEQKLEVIPLEAHVANTPLGQETELATLLSLAQKTVTPREDAKTINILPSKLSEKYRLLMESKREKIINLLLIFLLLVANLTVFYFYFHLRAKISLQEKTITEKESLKSQQVLKEYKEKVSLINNLFSKEKTLKRIISELDQTPKEIQIERFSFSPEKNEVVLTGKANSRSALLKYKDHLEKTGLFTKISFPFSSLEKESNLEFRIILKI